MGIVFHTQRTTAGHPHCLHTGENVAGFAGRACLVAGGTRCCCCAGLCFFTEWTCLTWAAKWSPAGVLLAGRFCIELQPVACSWGIVAPAFSCDQDMPGLRSAVRVGRRISVSTRGSVGGSALPSTQRFEGWCSPRCFGPRTASGSCCGDGGPSLVRVSGLRGACRPSNEHEDGRPVALKTDLAYTKMDQPSRQTNGRTTSKVILWTKYRPRRPTRWTANRTMDLRSGQTWP